MQDAADPIGLHVLVNDVDGTLLDRFDGAELPVTIDVVDGQTITWIDASLPSLSSYRVTPELTRIERAGPLSTGAPCDVAGVMPIAVTVPEIPGAALYEVQTGTEGRQSRTTPGTIEVELSTCASVADIDIVVTAMTSEGEVIGLEALRDVPYAPGEPASFDVTLPPPERDVFTIDVTSIAGMEHVSGYGQWMGTGPGFLSILDPSIMLDAAPSSDALTYAPAVVDPGFGVAIVQVHARRAPEGDACVTSQIFHVGATGQPLAFDARGLRTPTAVGETGWGWAGDGDHGVIVFRGFEKRHGLWWSTFEDPRRDAGPAVFPEVPDDLPGGLVPADATFTLSRIGHYALEGTPSYAAYLASADDTTPRTSRATSWRRCDR